MKDYLAFIDEIGSTTDGKFIYRFDFTKDVLSVWGEYFNVVPCAIIPNLQPDENCLSKRAKVIFPVKMAIAKYNCCFSMQDCIDGIFPLMFSEIGDDMITFEEKPLFFRFGENFDDIVEKFKKLGLEFFDIEEIENKSDEPIESLINRIGNNDDKNNDDPF